MLRVSSLLCAVALTAAESQMFGLSQKSALVKIDTKTGKMTEVTKEHPTELDAQELSAIDSKRGKYYSMGVNSTTGNVNLCVWSLTSGYKEQTIKLPFKSSPFVGVGEALDVDPVDGTIILMGHDPTRGNQHCVYTADPVNFKLTAVADLGGTMTTDLLGGSTAYDHDKKVWYGMTAVNGNSSAPKPQPEVLFQAVELQTGKVTNLSSSLMMAGLAYDSQTHRIYGTIVAESATGKALPPSSAVVAAHAAPRGVYTGVSRERAAAAAAGGIVRSLAYFDAEKRDKIVTVKALSLAGTIGDVHTIDASKRIHYTLLIGKGTPGTPYVASDFCSKHHETCPSGSSCCTLQNSTTGGYCFAAPSCSSIPPEGGDPLAAPAYILGVRLDDGTEVTKTPICSLEPSAKTVNASCPWSIEVDSPK